MTGEPRLAWEALELQLRTEAPAAWHARLQPLNTNRFNQHKLLLDRFATGGELKTLFQLATNDPHPHPGFQPWRAEACRFSPSFRARTARFRRRVHGGRHHDLVHYTRADAGKNPPGGLVIGFTGNVGLLMAPTPWILTALGLLGQDLLLVRRHSLEGYFSREGAVFADITEHLERQLHRLRRLGLRRSQVRTLGTSAGGLAALAAAQRLGLTQGVAIGAGGTADTFRPGGPVQRAHEQGRSWWWPWRPSPSLVLACPEHNDDDRRSAAWVARHYLNQGDRSRVTCRLYRGCTHHTLFLDLLAKGVTLEQALPSLLGIRPGPDPLAIDVTAAELLADREDSDPAN